MAEAREQGPTGHVPVDPAHGSGDVRAIKVDMGQGPPPARRPADRPAARVGAGIVVPSVLALLFGAAGAWGYERFLGRPDAGKPVPARASEGRDAEARKDLAGLEDRLKDLSSRCDELAGQYRQLQARVESRPAPELGPIEQKVAQVDRLSREVDEIGKKVAPLPRQLEQSEKRIAELDQKVQGLHNMEAAVHARSPRGRDRQVSLTGADRPVPAAAPAGQPPADDDRPVIGRPDSEADPAEAKSVSADSSFESGVELFRRREYSEAYAVFRNVLQSQADDARTWYYAALSYGLATGDWGQMTRSMADEGAAREKANRPPKAEVDAALAGLTKATGKEWIDYFRNHAH